MKWAFLLLPLALLGACDEPNSQVPSHRAEFMMSTADYPALMIALDDVAAAYRLKRFGAAPGLDELIGRKVLFADYRTRIEDWRAALSVTDVKEQGRMLLRVYADYFEDPEQRQEWVSSVTAIARRFGGTLARRPE